MTEDDSLQLQHDSKNVVADLLLTRHTMDWWRIAVA